MPSLAMPGAMNILPGSPISPTPTPTLWAAAAPLTLMMLLRLGVARAASRRPASLSPGAPAAPGSAIPLRRSLIRPPEAAGAASPEAASEATRGSSSPPAASRSAGPSLLAAPSAMAKHVWGLAARQNDRHRVSSPWHGCARAPAPGGSPAGLCLSARRQLQRRPQLCRKETSPRQRRPRAVVQEVSGRRGPAAGAGRRCEREGEAGEKQREVPEET